MKKLITLRGNSGSGKTTIARALQEKFGKNTMLLSQDVIRRDILKTNDGAGTRANDVLIMLLEYGHAHNELVILEGILNSRWYTPLFDAAKALYGENICAYYFDLPFEETLRRHQTKDKRTEFGEEEMRRWWNEKDYAPALNEQTLTPDMMQDEIIDRICADPAFMVTREEVEAILKPEQFTGRSEQQVEEFLGGIIRPLLAENKALLGEKQELSV